MVRGKKWAFFFGPKFSVFGPKIRFLIWDRDFRQWTVCSPRRSGRFGAFGSIFRLFVPELWPFSWGDPSDAAKSLTPPHYAALSDSNSPSALSAQPLRACALHARAGLILIVEFSDEIFQIGKVPLSLTYTFILEYSESDAMSWSHIISFQIQNLCARLGFVFICFGKCWHKLTTVLATFRPLSFSFGKEFLKPPYE